jgi:hypothetical protein
MQDAGFISIAFCSTQFGFYSRPAFALTPLPLPCLTDGRFGLYSFSLWLFAWLCSLFTGYVSKTPATPHHLTFGCFAGFVDTGRPGV